MRKRSPARKGLSYLDANRNRLITMEDDVLHIRSTIESTWPELEVFFDTWEEIWVVVEHCRDGIDRLALKHAVLDHNLLRLIQEADSHTQGFDIERTVDDWNAKLEAEKDYQFRQMLGDFAERFHFALRKDGVFDHEEIYGTSNKKVSRHQAVNG